MANGLTKEQIAAMPREEKVKLIQQAQAQQIAALPREQKIKMIQELQARQAEPETSIGEALRVGVERGATLGFRPVIAGAGAGLGAGVGEIQRGGGLMEAIEAAKKGFVSGRREAVEQQERIARERPGVALGGEVAGSLLTLPFTAVRGLKGAAALGGVVGAGEGLSKAEKVSDVPEAIAKGALTGVATEGILRGTGALGKKAVGAIAETEIAKAVGRGVKKAGVKTAEALTGVPEKAIQTFAEKGKKVNAMIKRSGGDLTEEADTLRRKLSGDIQKAKSKASQAIGKELSGNVGAQKVDANPFLQEVDKIMGQMDPVINKKEIEKIGRFQDVLIEAADENAQISLRQVQALRKRFDEEARDTFLGGKIFAKSAGEKRAARAISDKARNIINEMAPQTREANKTLSKLRTIEKNMNKNLIAEGKPEGALVQAGLDLNKRNVNLLNQLGKLAKTNPLEAARELAAAKVFAKPSLTTTDVTGKGVERALKAFTAGTILGDPIIGSVAALLTTPTALKTAIRAGQITNETAKILYKEGAPKVKSLIIQNFGRQVTGKQEKETTAIERRLKGQR